MRWLSAIAVSACLAAPLAAQGKAPAPEFSVKYSFEETVARLLAQGCPALAFDHDGFDRHIRALIGEYSDRGHHSRQFSRLFAPIQPERYERYFVDFAAKYDLTAESADADWCAAGRAEADWRTPIGRMLKVTEE